MRDIRGDLQDRANFLEEQINAQQAHFEKLVEQLNREHESRLEDLKSELDAVIMLMELEQRRAATAPAPDVAPRASQSTAHTRETQHRREAPDHNDDGHPPSPLPAAEVEQRRPARMAAPEAEHHRAAPEPDYRRHAGMAVAPDVDHRRPAAVTPAAETEHRRAEAEPDYRRHAAMPSAPQADHRRPVRMPPAQEAEHHRRPASLAAAPEAPQHHAPQPQHHAPQPQHHAPQHHAPQPQPQPQQPLADFLMRKLGEVGAMSRDDLRRLALQEGYFADGDSAERGVHATLINVVKAGFIRQLPNGNFAPASVLDTIRMRRAI